MYPKKILKILTFAVVSVVGLWLFISLLLPLTLPFFIAFFLSVVTEPAAVYLAEKKKFPRWAAGAFCTFAVYLLLFAGLYLLGAVLLRRLGVLLSELPDLFSRLSGPIAHLHDTLTALALRLPDGLGQGLSLWVEEFFRTGAGLLEGLPQRLFTFAANLAQKLPGFVLFLFTTIIASFMTSAQLPLLRKWLNRALPATWRKNVTEVWHRVKTAASGWLKAQSRLILLTFCILTAGLLLLGMPSAIFAALTTALLDALPVFGSGAVLIPWALVQFLQGRTLQGIGLLLLYGTVAITRATLEPRLLGHQMGLPPLLTLAALYVGAKLCGLWGLLLFPFGVSVAAQLIQWGRRE